MDNEALLTLTADIVSAHVANNNVAGDELAGLVQRVHQALAGLGQPAEEAPAEKVPVVSVRASVKPDYLVCMECGKKQKMLKRHLETAHEMTPDQYRKDYGLPSSYPMVAETYSARRRDLAKQIGLGRKPGEKPGSRRTAAAPANGEQTKEARKPRKPRSAPSGETGEAS